MSGLQGFREDQAVISKDQQREFFRLVVDWFVCRSALLGDGTVRPGQRYDICSWMIGECATYGEIALLLRECHNNLQEARTVHVEPPKSVP